jgi:phthalate 4,5-cis-dihydrodiol dehydrogenase
MSRKLRLGIVGLGRAATSILPSFLAHPQVTLTAGADLRKDALDKFARQFGAETYQNAEDLCKSPNVDAVYIATPHQFHAAHTVMAASYGKDVMVEKPMALTLEDCDAMNTAANRHGIKLLVGHTHSFDPPILATREIIQRGEMGRLRMLHTWNFTNFLYRPRRPEELDTTLGGGIVFNQLPHQVDTVRFIGGGMVASVRSMVGVWDPERPTEGSHVTYLEFVDGVPATIIYSGYDHFDSDEFHFWIGEGGQAKKPDQHGQARRSLKSARGREEEAKLKASTGFGGPHQRQAGNQGSQQPHFGITIVSCDDGDLRPAPDGVLVYGNEGQRKIVLPPVKSSKSKVIEEFYDAVVNDQPLVHDGRWGKATLEVCLAVLRSAHERREIYLSHQVPVGGS